jgi:hypothetical protein
MHVGRSLVSLVSMAVFLGLVGPATAVSATASAYEDPEGAYRLTLPDNWHPFSSDDRGTDFTDTVNGTIFAITTHPDDGMSLDEAIRQAADPFTQQPDLQADPGGVTDLTIGGEPAKEASFHNNTATDSVPLWAGAVAVIDKGTVYAICFLATPGHGSADVTTILASWQFP